MLFSGYSLSEIQNHLGHDNMQSTTLYLQLDLNRRRHIQKRLIRHMESILNFDPKIEELLKWESDKDMMDWLDDL